MNPADILALLPVKPEDMPKIASIPNKPSLASIKAFKESIQDQAVSITICDRNLGLLRILLRASYFDPLNNGNPFLPPTDPKPATANTIGTAAQINAVRHLYKEDKEKFTTYCEFCIILISVVTTSIQKNTWPLSNIASPIFSNVNLLLFLINYALSVEPSSPPT